jgi:hypothetical protein
MILLEEAPPKIAPSVTRFARLLSQMAIPAGAASEESRQEHESVRIVLATAQGVDRSMKVEASIACVALDFMI